MITKFSTCCKFKSIPIVGRIHLVLYICLFFLSNTIGQVTENNIEIRIKNDDAGEISNWLNTGDDLGETQSLLISVNILNKDSIYNFRLKVESNEYAALNDLTPERRDILFTELNNFQLAIDNNKFKDNSNFFSFAAGLYYIQSNKITIGATGQKYFWHKWVVDKIFSNKHWIYVNSPDKDYYIPYSELEYGHNKLLFKKAHSSLNMINNLEGRIASNYNYTGIGGRTYFNLKFSNERFRMHTINLEAEGYYLTNISQYQTAYLQFGTRFNFKHLALYAQLNKPIKKYIDNPLIKYDDMELLFNYGLIVKF